MVCHPPHEYPEVMGEFLRARTTKQKAERHRQILQAARAMLEESGGSREISLNALARRVGMAKSNVYRYFESREAVLLELLVEEWLDWGRAMEEGLVGVSGAEEPLGALADLLTSTVVARPHLGQLMTVLPSVLEHNLSAEAILEFKRNGVALLGELAAEMHGAVPALSVAQHLELLRYLVVLTVGLWPQAHPSEAAAQAMEDPSVASLRHDYARDLRRGIELVARGLCARVD